jgi:hypothetical protein
VHIPCRTNPADFLTRKRFRNGQGPALTTGYDDPGSSLELYAAAVVFTINGSEHRQNDHKYFFIKYFKYILIL